MLATLQTRVVVRLMGILLVAASSTAHARPRPRPPVDRPTAAATVHVTGAELEAIARRTFPDGEIELFSFCAPDETTFPSALHVYWDGDRDALEVAGGTEVPVSVVTLRVSYGFPEGQRPTAKALAAWTPPNPRLRPDTAPPSVGQTAGGHPLLRWEVPAHEAKDLRDLLTRWRAVRAAFEQHFGFVRVAR